MNTRLGRFARFGISASLIIVTIAGCAGTKALTPAPPVVSAKNASLTIPVTYYKLPNGLKVVFSEDHSVPVATVGVYYNIGFRIEPKNRTGFAHLFEHMMFQGSGNLAKNEFFKLVQGMGGVLNGSTRFDYTNYYEAFPSNALETMLWAEADRMKSLAITEANLTNQKGVVTNEVKVNVLNRPYGGFPWLDVPQYANQNWYNAHNFYGDLAEIEAATLDEVRHFFDTYYAPGNAVLVVVGDIDQTLAKQWVEKYFAPIAARTIPKPPDVSEPEQTKERHAERTDALAPRPALAIAYHTPPRWTDDYFAFGLIDQILLQGEDSRLHQDLVEKRGYTDNVSGGINTLGNMFDYSGPMLWTVSLIHDPTHPASQIVSAFDENVARLLKEPVTQAELDRARTKIRSGLYDMVGSSSRFGLVGLLAGLALFDDAPDRINQIEAEFAKVTPATVLHAAQQYLQPENRTVLEVRAGAATESKP